MLDDFECQFDVLSGKKERTKERMHKRTHTGTAIKNAITAESQTAFKGTSCLFTTCHASENGMAPSLENAYTILHINKDSSHKADYKKKLA
jgi:hypothetical protein